MKNKKMFLTGTIAVVIILIVAIIFVSISALEKSLNPLTNSKIKDENYIFLSPFANSDDISGNSKLDDDAKTTYFKPYRNSVVRNPEIINGQTIHMKGWAIWGLYAENLKNDENYRVTISIAVDSIPEDPYAVIAQINTHQMGLDNGHHICCTPNDYTREIFAGEFENTDEFMELSMDFKYQTFGKEDLNHNHDIKEWIEYAGGYDEGKIEIRVGWEDESVGIKISEIKIEKLKNTVEDFSFEAIERLPVNRYFPLKTELNPVYSALTDIIWESSDNSVASISNGIINTKRKGETDITVKSLDGKEEKFKLEVYVPVEEIIFNEEEKTIKVGEYYDISAIFQPEESKTDILWSSSDEKVATVENGRITAISNGITQINAKAGFAESVFIINVSDNFKDVILDVNIEKWAYDAINNVCAKGIMEAIGEDTFDPEGIMKRKDFLLSTAKLLGYKNYKTSSSWPFADNIEDTYKDAILFLYEQGIFYGDSSSGKTYINGDNEILREEALSILGKTIDRNTNKNADIVSTDKSLISDWAIDGIKNIVSNNIKTTINNNGKEYINPKDKLTRKYAADLFTKLEINIASVAEIPSIKTYIGKEIQLPKTVKVTLTNGFEKDLNIIWSQEDIDKIKSNGSYTINGKIKFRSEIKNIKINVNAESYVNAEKYGETFMAGYCSSKAGWINEDNSRVKVLPVGTMPGPEGLGDHGLWGIEYELEPGRYLINLVMQVDKSTATKEALEGAQIARVNPAFNNGADQYQLRSLTLSNFENSNTWYNINCELVVLEGMSKAEIRLWYSNNVTIKIREIEIYGISAQLPYIRAEETEERVKDEKKYGETYAGICNSNARHTKEGDIMSITANNSMESHGIWGAVFNLKPGKYLINFVMQVDKESASEEAKNGAQIARINPAFGNAIESQLRSIQLWDFKESNQWTNITCEIVVPEGATITEARIWYSDNVDLKVKEIQIWGIDAKIP